MRCYLGFLLCVLALTAASIASEEDQAHVNKPVGDCPSIDGVYPEFLPDSQDPTIYYMCSHGRPILQKCPPNLVFDPVLKTCKYSNQALDGEQVRTPYSPVGECPEVDGDRPVYLPDSENRTIFYECSNGVPVQLLCSPGLVFNPTTGVCVFP